MSSMPSRDDAKAMARRLRAALVADGVAISHSRALELVAGMYGAKDWNTLAATASGPADSAAAVVPILRIFDWRKACEFYVDYLGFALDWEQWAGDHTPRYGQVSRDGAWLHLSEHHGDGTPGSALVIGIPGIEALHAELAAKPYAYALPGIEQSTQGRTMTVHDPFGNRISFLQRNAEEARIPDELPPIVNSVSVAGTPTEAFDQFTSFTWWRDYGLQTGGRMLIDDGNVILRNPSGDTIIGDVTRWEPGSRYGQTFTLAQDADHPTTLDVSFTARGPSTQITLAHGGWNATNADRRGHFADWPVILGHFVDSYTPTSARRGRNTDPAAGRFPRRDA